MDLLKHLTDSTQDNSSLISLLSQIKPIRKKERGMDYAIIQSGFNLLEVIKLSEWQSYEWDDFSVVKSSDNHEIKWFNYEHEAVDFMMENFDREKINPKYFTYESINGEYYID